METKKLAGTILSVSSRTCVFLLVVVFLYFFGKNAFRFGTAIFNEQAPAAEGEGYNVTITIPEDASNSDVAKILEKNGLVEDNKLFFIQLSLSNYAKAVVPGTYTLNTSMKPSEIMVIISPEPETTTEE